MGEEVDLEDPEFEPEESTEEHRLPLIYAGTWVRLGSGENVPEELHGHEATVSFAPMHLQTDPDEFSSTPYQYQEEDDEFTVETRDQYSATLTGLKRSDFQDISPIGGRTGLTGSSG
jgi:hypothetical protein